MFKYMFFLLPIFLFGELIDITNLRTNLYSKNDTNILKKIDISLEIQTESNISKAKVIDSVNIIISSFFYEDIFTEIGKLNFKQTLEKFIEKKYKVKVDDVYILSLNSVEKFDINELKEFLKDNEDIKQQFLSSNQDDNKTKQHIIENNNTLENNVTLSPKIKDVNTSVDNVNKLEQNSYPMSNDNPDVNLSNPDFNASLKQLEDLIKDLNSSN